MNREELREAVARALCEADPLAPAPDASVLVRMKQMKAWEARLPQADAVVDLCMDAAANLADCYCGPTARKEKFCGMIGCGHDVANNIRALKPAPNDPNQRINEWVAPLDRLSVEQIKNVLSYDGPEVGGKDEDPHQP